MAPHSSTFAWKIPWQRSLVGCSPLGREESDTTERLHFHFSLSYIGEGNGNPLQCSCLENPKDSGGWWAAIYGVAQSRTQLKRLSSSSSSSTYINKSIKRIIIRHLKIIVWRMIDPLSACPVHIKIFGSNGSYYGQILNNAISHMLYIASILLNYIAWILLYIDKLLYCLFLEESDSEWGL